MKSDELRHIGAILRDARQEKGFNLRELSSLADVSISLLSQIENGKTNPSVVTLYTIATALELPITYFFPQAVPNNSLQATHLTASEARLNAKSSPQNTAPQPYSLLTSTLDCVVFADQRVSIELKGGIIWERLTTAASEELEFLQIHYQPQATSGAAMSRHSGREFGMVLEGELFLELGFDHYSLHRGDSVIFDSMTPHRLTNKQDSIMRAIWVVFNPPQVEL